MLTETHTHWFMSLDKPDWQRSVWCIHCGWRIPTALVDAARHAGGQFGPIADQKVRP